MPCLPIVATIHNNEIDHNPNRITKLAPFIKKYNWNGINFPTEQKDWDRFEQNNKDAALNIFSTHSTKKKIDIVKTSKHNNTRKHKVILLIISDEDNNWHYICVKNLKALCRDVFSNNHGGYYCLNCLHACRTKNKLKIHERLCLNNKYCQLKLPSLHNNKLKYKTDEKSIKIPRVIFADLECLLKNNNDLKNDLDSDNTYRFKENLHVPSGYGLYLLRSYDQNLLTHYRGTDCMKKFVRALKVMIKMISKSKKANKIGLTSTEEYDYNCSNECYLCGKEFKDEESKFFKHKVKDFCYYTGNFKGAAHRECIDDSLKEIEIPVGFHNGSNYDSHFIIKEIAKEFDGIECNGENSEKYITFTA